MIDPCRGDSLNTPLFVLRSKTTLILFFAAMLQTQLILFMWGGLFFGAISASIFSNLKVLNGWNVPLWLFLVFFILFFFFATALLLIYLKWRNKDIILECPFYKDAFGCPVWRKHVMVKYKSITRVYAKQDFLQRKYGVGTIVLEDTKEDVILIPDVEDVQGALAKIKGVMGAALKDA